jgi:hypothetical protein
VNSEDILELAQRSRALKLSQTEARRVELGLGIGAVHRDAALTSLAVMYENREFIADKVMPVISVAKKSDEYFKFAADTMMKNAAVDLVGAESLPGRPSIALDSVGTYSCRDRALMDFISIDEELNADVPLSPRMDVTEILTNYLHLAREIRVAAKVFGSGNYGSNTAALAGADRWDVSTSDPVAKINTALRAPVGARPDTMVIGEEAWDALRVHPKILQYVLSRASSASGATPLMVDPSTVAAMFRLREVIVGEAIYNTSAEGAAASYSRVWGKSCALIKVESAPSKRRTRTFGYSFRFGQMETYSIFAELPGRAGGTYIKVSHSDDDAIIGGDKVGYLYTTVVS